VVPTNVTVNQAEVTDSSLGSSSTLSKTQDQQTILLVQRAARDIFANKPFITMEKDLDWDTNAAKHVYKKCGIRDDDKERRDWWDGRWREEIRQRHKKQRNNTQLSIKKHMIGKCRGRG